ncbi:MAG: alpha/beta hydrolase [Endozoicomonas sp.]
MDIAQLKIQLKPLDLSSTGLQHTPGMHERDYFSFYGIDLENQLDGVRHELGHIDTQGYRVACHIYRKEQARGTFFLLHGYYDHVGLFPHILKFMLESGYSVFAFDLPGHGLSSGSPASIPDFGRYTLILKDILKLCQNQLPAPWHAYGQSTGCAILTDLLMELAGSGESSPFDKVVLSAPLVRPWLWRLGRLQLYLLRPFIRQLSRNFTDNCRDEAFLKFAYSDPLTPRVLPTEWVSALGRWIRKIESVSSKSSISPLIIQGTCDRTIDAKHNIQVLSRLFTRPQVLYLEGARHHLPNELPEAREEYMKWLSALL